VNLGEIATGIIPSWMVMARVDSSQGLGTRSSPGKDLFTSASVAPHLQCHGLSTGLNKKLPALTSCPQAFFNDGLVESSFWHCLTPSVFYINPQKLDQGGIVDTFQLPLSDLHQPRDEAHPEANRSIQSRRVDE
jgi:hypothetical protein